VGERGISLTAGCSHRDTWFNRSICAEPCGSMHDVCVDCGQVVDYCPLRTAEYEAEQRARTYSEIESILMRHIGDGYPTKMLDELAEHCG
jgi:hypothetical protein